MPIVRESLYAQILHEAALKFLVKQVAELYGEPKLFMCSLPAKHVFGKHTQLAWDVGAGYSRTRL